MARGPRSFIERIYKNRFHLYSSEKQLVVPPLGRKRFVSRNGSVSNACGLKAGLRTISIDRVAHHLTAARPRRPTADHRRKFPRGSARYDDLDLIRPREFAVTLFAIDRRALVKLSELRSLAAIIFIFLDRNARILEQKLTDRIFGKAAATERLHVLGAKRNHRLPCETEAIGEDRRQRAADGLQDRAAFARVMFADAVRRLGGEERHRALPAVKAELGVERRPRILFFVLGDAVREFARIAERGHIQFAGPRPADIGQDQLERASER